MTKPNPPKLLISLRKSRRGGIPRGAGADSRHYTPQIPTAPKNNLVLEPSTTLPIKIRAPQDKDWNYIYDSWKRSFKETMPWVPAKNFFQGMGERIEAIKNRKETRFFVACDPDDENFIFGWGCFGRGNLVHYVFVKQAFRHARTAARLVAIATDTNKPIAFTHWTRVCEKLSKTHLGSLKYEPSKLPKP
tara:strand:- start:331 stop:900 length:570 start_codon:yes stop_codon:yes gene_type:complete